MKAFTESWLDKFTGVYEETPMVQLSWFTACPGVELVNMVIQGVIKRGDRVIDLGSGPGVDAVFLAAQGMSVTAVDLSPDAVRRAEAWARLAGVSVDFLVADVLNVPRPAGGFDVATDSFVFHNMRDDARRAYADEVHRLLVPGGLFVLNSFSDHMVSGTGPRRISSGEILQTFDGDRFACEELRLYRNLPTEAKPDQIHWIGRFRTR